MLEFLLCRLQLRGELACFIGKGDNLRRERAVFLFQLRVLGAQIGELCLQAGVFGQQMVVFVCESLLLILQLSERFLMRGRGFFDVIDNVCAGEPADRRAESGKVGHKSASNV